MNKDDVRQRLVSAGKSLDSDKRLPNETGWQIRCRSGEIVNVFDSGRVTVQGKNTSAVKSILGLEEAEETPHLAHSDPSSRNVFVVYGHDQSAKTQLEAMLRRWKLEPLILDQLASEGQTIIEKLEKYTNNDVQFAVVLATPDDMGYPIGREDEKQFRARQNVILELGMLLNKLGRPRVAILLKSQDQMERPSDIQGLIYLPFVDDVEEIKLPLAKELHKQGLGVDLAKL